MAGLIKGITIEFGANTQKLNKALGGIQGQLNKTNSELKQVDNALKFNPGNTTLLKQKFDLLKQSVVDTKAKLQQLEEMQQQMDENDVDETTAQYRELEREIVKTKDQLKQAEDDVKSFGSVGKQQAEAVGQKFKDAGEKISSVGQNLTTKVTAPIVAGYAASAKYASDYEENLNKIDVAFGKSSQSVKDWANNARTEFGLSKVQATDAVSAFGALGKGIGLSEKDAASMSTTLAGLSADLGSYFNVGTDESAKALEGIFTGEGEALKKFGVVMTDTNLQKFAEDNGKVWSEMSEGEKATLRYQYVLSKTKDAQGDFSRTNDGTANSVKIFQSTVQDLATGIGTTLIPIITPVIQKFTALLEKFDSLSPGAKKIITIIGIVVAAIGPLLVIIGTLASAIGSIITIAPMVGSAFSVMLGPVGIVIAAIAAAIAIGVALYKNWDTIKAKLAAFKNFMVSVFNAIKAKVVTIFKAVKDAITKPIHAAVDFVKKMISKIKGFFKFKVSLPHIKLPHFGIKPKGWELGDLLKGVIPTLGINWYAKGGIFNSPSVIGVGEAGAEAVIPIDKLNAMMNASNSQMISALVTALSTQAMNGGGEYKFVINLGGANVATQIFKLNKQGQMILEA